VVLLVVLAAFAVAAVIRLADWQVAQAPVLQAKAMAQLERPADLPTVRGRILDRNGRVLALTGYRDRLVAYPKLLVSSDPAATAERRAIVLDSLTEILGLSPSARARVEEQLAAEASEYAVIARQITEEQSLAVREAIAAGRSGLAPGTVRAVGLEPQPVRIYPNAGGAPGTTLASHLLGFVSADGVGNYGIEQEYNGFLAGRPTKVAALRDPFGRLLGTSARVLEPGVPGQDIRLTIDAGIQLQLEKELYAAQLIDKAKRVSAVVMDPETGEILAWASVPGYNANQWARQWLRDPEAFRDPILSSTYEPGSVMKMFTAAAALDSKRMTLEKTVKDSQSLSFPPYTVRNADHRAMGYISFRDAIAYSRNVATARTAARLGRNLPRSSAVLYRMWQRLGIGRSTGIDLAGEEVGIVRDPAVTPWAPIDLANRSFGQGVSVTQIQLLAGYTPMINGGFRVTPHFLQAVGTDEREVPRPQRVLSASVSGQLHQILDHVTGGVPWYAEGSLIPGYQVGGKTGTAQIWMADKQRYSLDVFNFSYVGYVGGDQPEAVIAVRIQEAKVTSKFQGAIEINLTSYQLGRRIAMGVKAALDIPRSRFDGAGYPIPLSHAEQDLEPDRYRQHLKEQRNGKDVLKPYRERYQPKANRTGDREDTSQEPAGKKDKGAKADRAGRADRAPADDRPDRAADARAGGSTTPDPTLPPGG
jgi:cell division protein FtsI/penicillin-binding protein 2